MPEQPTTCHDCLNQIRYISASSRSRSEMIYVCEAGTENRIIPNRIKTRPRWCPLRDVLIVAEAIYAKDDEEAVGRSIIQFGDHDHSEAMAVYASGFLAAERQARHALILKNAAIAAKGKL